MKRWIIMALLLAALLTPAALGEGNRMLELNEGEYVSAMLSDGETLYVVGDDTLYTWREGDDAPTPWSGDIRLDGDREEPFYLYELSLFTGADGIQGVRMLRNDDGEAEGMQLFDLAFGDAGIVSVANVREVALPDELRDEAYFDLASACADGDSLILLGRTENDMALVAMDPDDSRRAAVRRQEGWDCRLLATPEGALLAEDFYDPETGGDQTALFSIDADGETEEVCRLPVQPSGVAADPVTGAVYAVRQGEACPVDLETGELGDPFGALPLAPERAAALGGDRYAALLGERVAVLDTGKRLDGDALLTISARFSADWIRDAVVEFSVEHPETAPVLSFDYVSDERQLEAMLAHDPEPDIYMLYASRSACRAMLERGYMLPLAGSEALEALRSRLYPTVAEAVSRDGALVAVPLREDCNGMGVSPKLVEKLGLSTEELPRDWMGFLDFLEADVKPNLDALGERESFTYDEMSAKSFHGMMFTSILQSYIHACQAAGQLPDYEDPNLVAALERLDDMDFTEYGLAEGDEDMGYGYSDDKEYLIQFDVPYDFQTAYLNSLPLPLGFGDDLPGVLALDAQVAFVNPFSEHAEAAVAFLEALAGKLPEETLYALCPDLNEPLRRPEMDREMAEYEKQIANAEAELEKAEPADRQELEDRLAAWRRDADSYLERYSWLISQERLDWYRANGDRVSVAGPSWFDQDTSGETWELFSQYDAGQITVREFLQKVNRKARMMAMEG